jgi:hypothetical protein
MNVNEFALQYSNEGTQELPVESESGFGKLSCLAVNQKGIGCRIDISPCEISRIVCSWFLAKNIVVFLPEHLIFQGKTTTFE